ncbi:sensor histidine kinase [Cellulomonas sp. PhB143]|uniref:sensor histidine kinase n=1 Tax=Cellulomonas sp. PhB143 TaxID=2485186 RepID=UPI0013152CD5|nr:sensor histidine kinase [Cellulomonas sp. PhB143]
MSVRGKILAAIAVPVFVLFLAAALISVGAIGDARVATQTRDLVAALKAQDDAGQALAQERALTVVALTPGSKGAKGAGSLDDARAATDAALDTRDGEFDDLDTSALSSRVGDAVDDTLADRAQLAEARQNVDHGTTSEVATTALYTGFIDRAIGVQEQLAQTIPDRDLAQYIEAYTQLDRLMAHDTLEAPLDLRLATAAQAGLATPVETIRIAQLVALGDSIRADAQESLDALPSDLWRLPNENSDYRAVRSALARSAPEGVSDHQLAGWQDRSAENIENLRPVRDGVRQDTVELSGDAASSATLTAWVTIGLAIVAFALSVLVAGFIAQRIVRPLRRLTAAAQDVRTQLPTLVEQVAVPGQGPSIAIEPIAVESGDEVGQLADAFNDVNATTVQVAREQAALRGSIAEMFVNVARRDQVLLNRQLAFLDDLERAEEDAGTLSNLFRLDHLATRMRRNAESLLVLAGIDSGRRVRQPMPASDVIRTASSEIEMYDRVRLNLAVDPHMLGHNALNAAHLLAELLENATMFSEPHTPVEVTVAQDAEAVAITIRDHGLGMTDQELVEAERRVAHSAASDVVGAQRLGLYVVGRLAGKLGAHVTFSAAEDKGTSVTVRLPAALFVASGNVPLPSPTDPLAAGTQAAAGQITAGPADRSGVPSSTSGAGLPVRGGAARPSTAPVAASAEPEAPLVAEVDLDALTDGTTSTGMPRRRARATGPGSAAPSESLGAAEAADAPQPGDLPVPQLPDTFAAPDEAWTPPQSAAPSGPALPSRSRRAAEAAAPAEPEQAAAADAPWAPPSAVPDDDTHPFLESAVDHGDGDDSDALVRSAMFSSFRSRDQLDTTVSIPVDLGPEGTDDVPGHPESEFHALAAGAGPLGDELRDTVVLRQEDLSSRFDEAAKPLTDSIPLPPAHVVGAGTEAPRTTWGTGAIATVPAAGGAQDPDRDDEPAADDVPPELSFDALPAFDELMADLPTRRSMREANARKRGLFGRRPRPESAAVPAAPFGPVTPAEAAPAPGAPADEAYRAPDVFPAEAASGPPATGEQPLTLHGEVRMPEPAADSGAYPSAEPWVPQQQWESSTPPAQEPEPAYRPQTEPTYRAPVAPQGGDALPAARPYDDGAVHDSVEARSEWLASAVLYEEMTSLLRSSNDFQEPAFAVSEGTGYQPTTTVSGSALRRRGQQEEAPPAPDAGARITRDPAQLRTRLSAFQAGTARGRDATRRADGEAGGSTDSAMTRNDVPDSAATSR